MSEEKMVPEVNEEAPKTMKGGGGIEKKSLGKKMWDVFVGDDIKDVEKHILVDILVPAAKDTLMGVIQAFLYGGYAGSYRGGSYRNGGKYDYSSASKSTPLNRRSDIDDVLGDPVDYRRLTLDYREDAQLILDEFGEKLKKYGRGSVASFYDTVRECFERSGKKIKLKREWTDEYVGWFVEDLKDMRVVSYGRRAKIEMPDAVQLRR